MEELGHHNGEEPIKEAIKEARSHQRGLSLLFGLLPEHLNGEEFQKEPHLLAGLVTSCHV